MFVKSVVAIALVASFTAAQNTTTAVDLSSIDDSTRAAWCSGQISTCGTLCGGPASANDCDTAALTFDCKCQSNDSAPGLEYYRQSLPTFICEETFKQCNANNVGNAAGQRACKQTEEQNCGQLDASNYTAPSTSSSSSTSSPTGSPSPSDASSSSGSSSSSTAAAPTLAPLREIGTGIVAAGVAAAFGLIL